MASRRRKTTNNRQLKLLFPEPECLHRAQYVSSAYVPAGMVCFHCGMLLSQFLPEPPEKLGYMSADWAWKHRDGADRFCNTLDKPPGFGVRFRCCGKIRSRV